MKVVVRCAHNRVTKADMEREIERLFQENKDLRVHCGHLRDQLNLSQQQSEARRQVICERDKTIQELEEKIADSSDYGDEGNYGIDHWMHTATIWREKAEALQEEKEKLGTALNKMAASHIKMGDEYTHDIAELKSELQDRNARIDELERQVEWLQTKTEEWAQVVAAHKHTIAAREKEKEALEDVIHAFEETRKEYEEEIHAQHVEKREWMQKYEELKAQKEADDKKSEEICTACNERYEDVLSDRNRLRERVARYEKSVTFAKLEEAMLATSRLREEVEILTDERNTAVDENTQLTFELAELKDKYEAERALRWNAENQVQYWRNEAQQKESNLRAAIEEREHWSDKAAQLSDEVKFYKSGRDASKRELEELDKEVERLRGVEESVETYRMARDVERQRRIEAEKNYQSLHEEYERVRDAADDYHKKCQELTQIKQDRFDAITQLIMKAVAADDTANKVLGFSEESK